MSSPSGGRHDGRGRWSGTILDGRHGTYTLGRTLGSGGYAEVYEAVDAAGHRVAIRMVFFLYPTTSEDRFRRGVEVLERLRGHPFIVHLHDRDYAERLKCDFLVLELLAGRDLAKRLATRRRIDPHTALIIVRQAAEGLAAMHALGFCHRDVKPSNLLVEIIEGEGGRPARVRVKVCDFDLAKVAASDGVDSVTRPEIPAPCSPSYASPEQLDAQRQPLVGLQSDVFSLGVMLHEMLTGRLPLTEEDRAELKMGRWERVVVQPAATGNEALDRVLARALELDPAARYASARDLADAMDEAYPEGAAGVEEALVRWDPTRTPRVASPKAIAGMAGAASTGAAVRSMNDDTREEIPAAVLAELTPPEALAETMPPVVTAAASDPGAVTLVDVEVPDTVERPAYEQVTPEAPAAVPVGAATLLDIETPSRPMAALDVPVAAPVATPTTSRAARRHRRATTARWARRVGTAMAFVMFVFIAGFAFEAGRETWTEGGSLGTRLSALGTRLANRIAHSPAPIASSPLRDSQIQTVFSREAEAALTRIASAFDSVPNVETLMHASEEVPPFDTNEPRYGAGVPDEAGDANERPFRPLPKATRGGLSTTADRGTMASVGRGGLAKQRIEVSSIKRRTRSRTPASTWPRERDAQQVRAFVTARTAVLQACFTDARHENPSLAGLLSVLIEVTPKGRLVPRDAEWSWSGNNGYPPRGSASLERCVLNRIRRWNIGSTGRGTFEVPFAISLTGPASGGSGGGYRDVSTRP